MVLEELWPRAAEVEQIKDPTGAGDSYAAGGSAHWPRACRPRPPQGSVHVGVRFCERGRLAAGFRTVLSQWCARVTQILAMSLLKMGLPTYPTRLLGRGGICCAKTLFRHRIGMSASRRMSCLGADWGDRHASRLGGAGGRTSKITQCSRTGVTPWRFPLKSSRKRGEELAASASATAQRMRTRANATKISFGKTTGEKQVGDHGQPTTAQATKVEVPICSRTVRFSAGTATSRPHDRPGRLQAASTEETQF